VEQRRPAGRLSGLRTLHTLRTLPRTMQDIVNILAISNRGRSRIGTTITTAIVEQNHHDKLFIVLPQFNQCRWIKRNNDPDFRIIEA
jgi:hypothetical protein